MVIYKVQKKQLKSDSNKSPIEIKNKKDTNSKHIRAKRPRYQARDKMPSTQTNLLNYFGSNLPPQKLDPTQTHHSMSPRNQVRETLKIMYTNIRSVGKNKTN